MWKKKHNMYAYMELAYMKVLLILEHQVLETKSLTCDNERVHVLMSKVVKIAILIRHGKPFTNSDRKIVRNFKIH
jgi:hypothetical protein